jgi:hypothetical protein
MNSLSDRPQIMDFLSEMGSLAHLAAAIAAPGWAPLIEGRWRVFLGLAAMAVLGSNASIVVIYYTGLYVLAAPIGIGLTIMFVCSIFLSVALTGRIGSRPSLRQIGLPKILLALLVWLFTWVVNPFSYLYIGLRSHYTEATLMDPLICKEELFFSEPRDLARLRSGDVVVYTRPTSEGLALVEAVDGDTIHLKYLDERWPRTSTARANITGIVTYVFLPQSLARLGYNPSSGQPPPPCRSSEPG